jgi:hypothetical protein
MNNKIMMNAWLALGLITLILIPFFGAWHHLVTVGICYVMYSAIRREESEADERQSSKR